MAEIKLQFASDGYRLSVDGETSETVDFGEPVEFVAKNGKRYLAFQDLPTDESEETESRLEDGWVYECVAVEAEQEDIEDEEEDGEEDEDGEVEDEDEEEDEEVVVDKQ